MVILPNNITVFLNFKFVRTNFNCLATLYDLKKLLK